MIRNAIIGSIILLLCTLQTPSLALSPAPDPNPPKDSDISIQVSLWASQQLGELSIETPFQLKDGENIISSLPEKLQRAMEYIEIFSSPKATNPGVSVTRLAYKPKFPANLDDTMNASMTGAINGINEGLNSLRVDNKVKPNPEYKYNSEATTINGLAARQTTYTQDVQGTPIQINGVFIQNGQKFWSILILSTGTDHKTTIKRILDSIQVDNNSL